HRHEGRVRPAGVEEPRLWLIEPVTKDGVPECGLSGMDYSPYILFRSLLTLRAERGERRVALQLPGQIDGLISQVYDDTASDFLSASEQDFWSRSRADHQRMLEREVDEAKVRQIKIPSFCGALARIVQEPKEEDNPDLHSAHQALTRLTRPTVSFICLLKEGESYHLPHDNTVVSTLVVRKMQEGGIEDIGRFLMGEVTSAHRGLLNELRTMPLNPREWKDVAMLARHHVIVFDEGLAHVGRYQLELDRFLGLTISRADVGEDE